MMARLWMMVSQILFLGASSLAKPEPVTYSKSESDHFTVAIFEHYRLGNSTSETPAEILNKNLRYYRKAAEVASLKGADMIVFPEYGFFPFMKERQDMRPYLESIPDHKRSKWNPCRQAEKFMKRSSLRRLSCMAMKNQIVVVTAIGDIRNCNKQQNSKCPDDGFWHHNAIVAFARDGTLIGVSRKEHLFFEESMDLPLSPQDPFFKTDFGTFAMYLCFDSVFKSMALAGRNSSVDAVIFSAMWIDYRPLLTSMQHFSSWAIGTGGNLIAPSMQYPGFVTTGSGIFAGKMGALKYTFNTDYQSKLIVSKVPKNRNQDPKTFQNDEATILVITDDGTRPYKVDEEAEGQNIPDVCYYKVLGHDCSEGHRCFHEPMTNYTFTKLMGPKGTFSACNNGLCCRLTYDAVSMNESFYLGVFNGSHNAFDRYFWCKEVCFVVRCDAFNGSECNTFPAHSQTVFNRLELNMNLTTDFVYPSVLKSGFRLSPVEEWDFNIDRHNGKYHGRLTYESDSNKPLVNVALKGRCYDRDPPYTR